MRNVKGNSFMVYFTRLSVSTSCRIEWWDDWSLMNGKKFERKWSWPNKDTIPVFSRKERTTINLPAEVLTEHPPLI
jgi:hypothetical protein